MIALRQSSRWRHWILQAVLWLLLGLMLLLAAAVSRYYLHIQRVMLGPPEYLGELHLRTPAGWVQRRSPDGLTFEEPSTRGRSRRKLDVWHARADVFLSPLDYLIRSGDLRPRDAAALLAAQGRHDQAPPKAALKIIPIAGWPGIVLWQTRLLRPDGMSQPVPWKQTLACGILPRGHALVLRLEGQGIADASDEDLLRRVAQSASLQGHSAPNLAAELDLDHDIRLRIPPGLAAAPANDKLRTGRVLVSTQSPSWLAVEVAPCVLMPGEKPPTLPAMLILRDAMFRPGDVQQLDQQTWMCPRQGDEITPALAFVHLNPDGRAILAEFRWNPSGAGLPADHALISRLWRSIADGLVFHGHFDRANLLESGVAAVRQLPQDAADLLDARRLSQRWQWYDESSPKESWVEVQHQMDARSISSFQDTNSSPPLASSGREICQWTLTRDWTAYDYSMTRAGSIPVLSQETHLADDKINTTVLDGTKPIVLGGGEVPAAYIPGGLLPLLIGHLPFQPMILRTESLPTPTGSASPALLTLILEPSFDLPKFLPGQPEAMRCWALRVSGSGQSSRWYLDGDGRLHSISFAGGIHLHRIDPAVPAME